MLESDKKKNIHVISNAVLLEFLYVTIVYRKALASSFSYVPYIS